MGAIRKSILAAVTARLVQEARKPENQRRAREFVAAQRARRSGTGGRRGRH